MQIVFIEKSYMSCTFHENSSHPHLKTNELKYGLLQDFLVTLEIQSRSRQYWAAQTAHVIWFKPASYVI